MRSPHHDPDAIEESAALVGLRLAELNRVMGADGDASPYPELARRRSIAAIAHDRDESLPDGSTRPVFNAYSWDAVSSVLGDGVSFSSSVYAENMGDLFGHSIIEMDDPDHRRYRSLLSPSFSRSALDERLATLTRPVIHRLIDSFVGDGRADLVSQLFLVYPAEVIGTVLAVERRDLLRFQRLAIEINGPTVSWDRALVASLGLDDLFRPAITERRPVPSAVDTSLSPGLAVLDLVSVLTHATLDGRFLSDDEIVAFLRLLTPAGADTPYRASSNLMFGLLAHPTQLAAVVADRSLIPQAVDEGVRWECPLLILPRVAVRDAVVCGIDVPAGAMVSCMLGSANRDPARWSDPDRFDIHRARQANLAFGGGGHLCVGALMARQGMGAVVDAIVDRLPNLRLAPDAGEQFISGMYLRAPERLDVVWDRP